MKNNDKTQSGRIYVIAGNYNVAKAVGLSEKAFLNGKPQWIMKNYDGSTFFCSEENLRVASGEEVKSWVEAFRAHRKESEDKLEGCEPREKNYMAGQELAISSPFIGTATTEQM